MKPYCVVRIDDQLADMLYGRRAGIGNGREFLVWANLERDAHTRPQDFSGDHPVYFVDTPEDAEQLASLLATKRPGTFWVVAKSTASFRCAAAPVAKAVFSDLGMLPA